jgi:predicted PurR-regulated permease PerM
VISPIVEGQQLDIHPLAVFISVLVGGSLFGVGGAVVAVPAAAMLQVLAEEVVIPWRQRRLALAGEPPLPPPA